MGFDISALETNGEARATWMDYETGDPVEKEDPDRLELLIGPLDSKEYEFAVSRYLRARKKYLRDLGAGKPLTPEANCESQIDGILEAVLLDWRHATENGSPVAFSRERARKLLEDNYDFFKRVREMAVTVANREGEAREDAEGN